MKQKVAQTRGQIESSRFRTSEIFTVVGLVLALNCHRSVSVVLFHSKCDRTALGVESSAVSFTLQFGTPLSVVALALTFPSVSSPSVCK